MKTTSLFIPLLTAVFVSAHGFLKTLTINGKAYTGNTPTAPTNTSSPIRLISTYFPIQGATNSALTCGPNSTAGSIVAKANPGDSLTFSWKTIDQNNWIHDTGPVLLYLANCGSTPCGQFDIKNAKWFKFYQQGRTSPGGPWVQAGLATGGVVKSSLPTNLAAGNYLLRSELISLQDGMMQGGAQFYVACSQIEVGGSGTGVPQSNELVSLPGAYSDDDPGILDVDVYNNKTAPYIFPGPRIAAFVTSSTGTSSSGSSSVTTTSTAITPGSVPSTASSISGPSSLPGGSATTSASILSTASSVCGPSLPPGSSATMSASILSTASSDCGPSLPPGSSATTFASVLSTASSDCGPSSPPGSSATTSASILSTASSDCGPSSPPGSSATTSASILSTASPDCGPSSPPGSSATTSAPILSTASSDCGPSLPPGSSATTSASILSTASSISGGPSLPPGSSPSSPSAGSMTNTTPTAATTASLNTCSNGSMTTTPSTTISGSVSYTRTRTRHAASSSSSPTANVIIRRRPRYSSRSMRRRNVLGKGHH